MKSSPSTNRIRSLLLAGLLIVGSACQTKGKAPGQLDALPTYATTTAENLAAAWRDVKTTVHALEILARNADSYPKILEKHRRNFQAIGIFLSIPLGPDIPSLKKQLAQHSQTFGLQIEDFVSTPDESAETPLPAEFDGPGPFDFEEGQLIGKVSISFRLSPLNLDKVELFCRALKERVERLVLLRTVKMASNGAHVQATVFFYHDVRAPIERLQLPRREQFFERVGLPAMGPDCTGESACPRLVEQIDSTLHAVSTYAPKAQEALNYLSQARLWEARAEAFERLQAGAHLVKYSQILR